MSPTDLQLSRSAFGRLILATPEGPQEVVPVRAFPIAEPDRGISLVDGDGHERAWIDRLAELPVAQRALVEEELGSREFVPEIRALREVSSFATPSTWQVDTDRGPCALVLKGEEDIRRLSQTMLMIADSNGIQYLIRDLGLLDRHSRRLLDRFL
ncbi:MAG: DUF1854 domain-containing protein [Betaproteobacteria bacterium]|nr:DUF1854 domain-containing protein [Betaproteobacteria bacterium]HNE43333.1 DUF1854 domain-containing protein [Rhodocyclaceae bacterium]HNM23072.1 DUF1854 domain-containing protein [Rhodocyclaceae bacterium]